MDALTTINWVADGHTVSFRLDNSELIATPDPCPFQILSDVPCRIKNVCVFVHFVSIFGMELNVGTVPLAETIEFAWAFQGNQDNWDEATVWIMPVEDPVFQPWLDSLLPDIKLEEEDIFPDLSEEE